MYRSTEESSKTRVVQKPYSTDHYKYVYFYLCTADTMYFFELGFKCAVNWKAVLDWCHSSVGDMVTCSGVDGHALMRHCT